MWFNICTVVDDEFSNLGPMLQGIKQNIVPHYRNLMWWIIVNKRDDVQKVMEAFAAEITPPQMFETIGYPIVIMPKNGDPRNTFLNACNHGYVYFCDIDNYPHPFLLKDLKHQLYGPSYKVKCVDPKDELFVPDQEYMGQYILSRPDIGITRFGIGGEFIANLGKEVNIMFFKESRSFYRKNAV